MSSNGKHFEEGSFTLLASGKPRWRSFGAGFGIEFVVLACALWIPALFPKQMVEAKNYVVTRISLPDLQPFKPQPKVQPKMVRPVRREVAKVIPKPEPVVVPDPPKPKLIEPVFAKLNAVPVVRHNPTQAPKINEWARMVPDKDTMSLGSSATPDLKKPKAPVQTGGFGDPNGLQATTRKMTQPVNINAAGGFDMPEGPGKGNGTGGAKGVQGVVESAGFGNGTAIAGGERHSGAVQEGGFSNDAQGDTTPHVRKTAEDSPATQGPVILFKPEPQYTAEGKADKIQGEVVLEVVFKASGQVEVVRVVKGLGHGLDENAELAARQIKFTPAKQDGQPVDFPANVRIDFELAY
jgi:TonB family protein